MDSRDLYGLPLERFTEERNALAKRLRTEARREEAAAVAKLRKPSVAAWAVNQLVRTQKREIGALFKAGDALQSAQAAVLGGRGDAGSMRNAAEAERAALDRLTQKARGLLSSEGHELTPAKLEQVSETLHAAAIDPDARDQVKDGCLERELRHVGLGVLAAAGAADRVPAPAPASGRGKTDRMREANRKAAREAQAAAKRQLRRAERDVREAERELAAAQERVDAATDRRDRARRTLEELT